MKLIGIVLIVLGVAGLAYGGLNWTTKEKVVDMGPLQVTQDKTHSMPLSPIAGGVCVVAGVLVLVMGGRQRS
jgi:uncharacterized membrane protein YidH (DUF202 family)